MTEQTEAQKSLMKVAVILSRDRALEYAKILGSAIRADTLTTIMTGFYLATSAVAVAKLDEAARKKAALLGVEPVLPSKEEAREMLVSLLEGIIDEVFKAQVHIEAQDKRSGI